MGYRRYPDVEIAEKNRPVPGDRPEDYTASAVWSWQWGTATGAITVSREGDNYPPETWVFDAERTGERTDKGAHKIRVAPRKFKYHRLVERHGTPTVRTSTGYGRSGAETSESVTLEEVPAVVVTLLESYDGVGVVNSLHE